MKIQIHVLAVLKVSPARSLLTYAEQVIYRGTKTDFFNVRAVIVRSDRSRLHDEMMVAQEVADTDLPAALASFTVADTERHSEHFENLLIAAVATVTA